MRRDSFQLINNDNLSVAFDTFYDRRNGVVFMVNPIAGIFDFQLTDEGNPNTDWNPVWDVRTGRFDGGWTRRDADPVQVAPLSAGHGADLGLSGWAARHQEERVVLSHAGVDLCRGWDLPALGRCHTRRPRSAERWDQPRNKAPMRPHRQPPTSTPTRRFSTRGDGDFGLDVKYGVTQNLTADFTYNTDFAQVEVDQQQVNLTRFSLFFPEKREFFSRRTRHFRFWPRGWDDGWRTRWWWASSCGRRWIRWGGTAPTVFFSRRIGLNEGLDGPDSGWRPTHRQGWQVQYRCTEHPDRRFAGSQRIVNQLHRPATQA